MRRFQGALATLSAAAVSLAVLAGSAPAHAFVPVAPGLTKSFSPSTVPLNGTSTMTLTINNSANFPVSGAVFSDNFPAGLQVASVPNATNTCGGTLTASAGGSSVSLSGGTVGALSSCSITVAVTGTTGGAKVNVAGPATFMNAPDTNAAVATLTVRQPPSIVKAFNVTSIPLGGSTILSFALSNPDLAQATGVAFTDNLPAGLVVANPNGLLSNCGGTQTALAGSGTVSLANGTIAGNSSCTLQVNVTGTTAGVKNNSVTASSAEGGTGTPNTATLTVVAPPTIAKSFDESPIPLNGTTFVTFTLTNPNQTATLTGVAFSDLMPPGLATTPATATVCSGSLTVTGAGLISLSGATIGAGNTCSFGVLVKGTSVGSWINTTGQVTSTEGGTGTTATANLVVGSPPTISKAFGASAIPLNSSTSLTFTLANPNAASLTGAAFSDSLPAGLVVASPNGLTNTCGGSVTATAGSGSIALTGGTIPASNSCTVKVNVKGTIAGSKVNTSSTVTTSQGLTSVGAATASLTVVVPPTLTKAFAPATIPVGATTTLTFTLTNPNAATPLTGVTFADPFPGGLMVATSPSVTNTCGGVPSVGPFALAVGYANGTVAAGQSCTFSVRVTATSAGVKNNTTTIVSSTPGGIGTPATASISVTP